MHYTTRIKKSCIYITHITHITSHTISFSFSNCSKFFLLLFFLLLLLDPGNEVEAWQNACTSQLKWPFVSTKAFESVRVHVKANGKVIGTVPLKKMSVECKDTCTRTQATHTHTHHSTYFIWNESFSLNLPQLSLTSIFRIKHFTLVMWKLFNSWRLNAQLLHDVCTCSTSIRTCIVCMRAHTNAHTHVLIHIFKQYACSHLDQRLAPIAGLCTVRMLDCPVAHINKTCVMHCAGEYFEKIKK